MRVSKELNRMVIEYDLLSYGEDFIILYPCRFQILFPRIMTNLGKMSSIQRSVNYYSLINA